MRTTPLLFFCTITGLNFFVKFYFRFAYTYRIITPEIKPEKIPITTPHKTSVGQCTNRYSRDNAIMDARIIKEMPSFRRYCTMATLAANDAEECPEGKE